MHVLNEWLDPRHIETHGPGPSSNEERERPEMWRFRRVLSHNIFQGSWYSDPFIHRIYGKIKNAELEQAMDRNVRFEKMLADEGALILKFWFHLSKDRQEQRLKAREQDPATRWRVTERDWHHFKLYDKFQKTADQVLRLTSTAQAPCYIIDGSDKRYRSMTLGKILHKALRHRLDNPPLPTPSPVCLPCPRWIKPTCCGPWT